VVFVFTALAIIIFYPSDEFQLTSSHDNIQYRFNQIGQNLGPKFSDVSYDFNNAEIKKEIINVIEQYFDNYDMVQTFLFVRDEENQLSEVFNYQGESENKDQAGFVELIDMKMVTHEIESGNENLLMVIPDNDHAVYYYYFAINDKIPAVFSTVFEHKFLVTSKKRIIYYFVILFQAALLVSLLLIYLINNKFKNPINRLIKGFEKTTRGEVFYMVESDNEGEIGKLSSSFNKMSKILFDKESQLKNYTGQLKRANNNLKESQEFLSQIIDRSPSSIITASTNGEIKIFNRKASEEFKIDYIDAIGKNINDLFTHPIEEIIANHDENLPDDVIEILCKRSNGTLFPAYLIHAPVFDRKGVKVAHLYFIRDISESKNFQDMMIRIDRYYTRGEMAGDIAHEINNFLTILSGNLELLPLLIKKDNPEKLKSKLELMRSTLTRISSFTEGLMDVGEAENNFVKADVNQLIQTVITFLQPQNKFDEIVFETELATDIPLVELDQGKIQQVLVNLINNGAEAMAQIERDKKLKLATSYSEQEGMPRVIISINDNGDGIPEEKQDILFDKRFTTKRKGHGIGLITCYKLIQAHKGDIKYSNDNGARFDIELPVSQFEDTVAVQANSPSLETSS
jgi:two-component system sporulation sensor kinase A